MLYVFHVDMGRMMTFDMTVALSSVENLKDTIERLHGIPACNIVLLVSGGEMLAGTTQVSYYSAGTDTNPIYMFLTGDIKLPQAMPQIDADIDLREQVDRCLELPAVYETVVKRAQLALKMYDLAREEEKWCERLIHEQHLQQQGWYAVVANMEDLTDEVRQRFKNFCTAFDKHLENRANYFELLRNFGDDLTKLSRIPILPALMSLAEEDFHGFDEFLDTDEVFARSQQQQSVLVAAHNSAFTKEVQNDSEFPDTDKNISSTSPNKKLKMAYEPTEESTIASETSTTSSNQRRTFTLLQWISAKENHDTLKLMSDECIQGLGTFNEEVYEKLKAEVQNIIKLADQGDVKDIKGLGERLCKLEEFKYKIKSMVQDQKKHSTALQQNQNRASHLRDASILPDLCASHQSQLVVMQKNHQKIREHKFCITKAKDELGLNLHMRLQRIVLIENAMSELDNRLWFYHRCLRRAERHINIIEQIHQAPSIYVAAVTEVVRRKIFSGEFRKWASKLADDFEAIHSEEINRRRLFNSSFDGHFLNILFPGMNDMPPAFANENPLVFDSRLPNITRSDIDMLSSYLPDLTSHAQLPDMAPVIHFFNSRSGEQQKERLEELLKQQVEAAQAFNVKQLINPRLGELQRDAGIFDESETDTEDFEKVKESELPLTTTTLLDMATSTSEMKKSSTARSTTTDSLEMHNVETLTEENENSIRAEVERLSSLLGAMSKLSVECLQLARANLETIRTDTENYKDDLQSELKNLDDKWNLLRIYSESKEEVQNVELNQLRSNLDKKNTELSLIKAQNLDLETLQLRCSTLEAQLEEAEEQIKALRIEKERAVADTRENLIHEHKTEIESLRCRFKLMASMELSPSDASIDKSSALSDTIEISQHEAICAQLRTDLMSIKDKEIASAVEAERSIWQSKIFPMNSESVMANVSVLKDMLEEKEKQLDMLREQDLMLTKENYQLKTRLDSLTNEDGNSWLREKIEYLSRDKCRLEEELTLEKSRRVEMETSVAELRSSVYEQACVVGSLPRSKSNTYGHKYIALESCSRGDIVFVVWSMRHGQFMVVQDSQSLYFVLADSLPDLNLRFPAPPEDGASDENQRIPIPYYAIGRVIDKEYCQARKDENRYRVTRGSKFYRVKLAALQTKHSARRERLDHYSINRSVTQSELQNELPTNAGINSSIRPSSESTIDTCSKDVTDYSSQSTTTTTTSTSVATSPTLGVDLNVAESALQLRLAERAIQTSILGEEFESLSTMSETCRFISVSKDEVVPATVMETSLEQKSVITEQPTVSSTNLELDLMLGSSTDLSLATYKTSTASIVNTSVVISPMSPTTSKSGAAIVIPTASCCSPSIPASVGTSEDSDEYRSLEAKDDTEFPLSE